MHRDFHWSSEAFKSCGSRWTDNTNARKLHQFEAMTINLRIHGKRFIGPTGLQKIKTVLHGAWFRSNLPKKMHEFSSNSLLFQIFYTIKIPKFVNFNRDNRIKSNIFGQKLRMDDALLIYFGQIVSFCAIIYSNTNSLQLFCKNSCLNPANFAD